MKVAFCTLGCKVNFYETEKMMSAFQSRGFEVVEQTDFADIFVINTCTVTNMADRKSRQMIHRGKKKNPNCVVVAVGCYAESDGDTLRQDEAIDLVLSNKEKEKVVDYVMEYLSEQKVEAVCMENDVNQDAYDFLHERTRAFIKVQNGCNQFCTYCIIPYVRGKLESRPEDEVVKEIEGLAKKGFKEVVITGIHLSSYGVDFSDTKNFVKLKGRPLLSLLAKIEKVEGIERIRLGSLEPRIITEEFLIGLVENKKVCPHFHLSLQSGCDETLARMNRHYTTKEYEEKCELLRKFFDNPAITTDVIVGFPGETDEEFEKTKAYLETIALAEMHVFKYSKRDGTKAAAMENQVSENVKTLRSNELLALNERLRSRYTEAFVGKEEQILFEEEMVRDGEVYLTGYNERYVKVEVPIEEAQKKGYKENEIFDVKVQYIRKK